MIAQLAKMLGLSTEHAEASMHSDRAARAVLTRRNLFAAGAALAAGSAFSFAGSEQAGFWAQNPVLIQAPKWTDILITLGDGQVLNFPGIVTIEYEGPVGWRGKRIKIEAAG